MSVRSLSLSVCDYEQYKIAYLKFRPLPPWSIDVGTFSLSQLRQQYQTWEQVLICSQQFHSQLAHPERERDLTDILCCYHSCIAALKDKLSACRACLDAVYDMDKHSMNVSNILQECRRQPSVHASG